MNELALQQSVSGGLRELALFAGCGGGILAAKLLGWRTVCAVEIEPYRAERLCNRQNEGFLSPFPIWNGDIADFDGRPWRGFVDVVSGGFPCQDISAANPFAQGITGARSGLWKEMRRIICEVGPLYVFVENSPMLTSRGLGVVLGDLAEMGLNAVWGVLGADDIGAFHRRDRIYILGYANTLRELQPKGIVGDIGRRSGNASEALADGVALGDTNREGLERHSRNGNRDGRAEAAGHLAEAGLRALADSGREQTGRSATSREEERGRSSSGVTGCDDALAYGDGEPRRIERAIELGSERWARDESSRCGDSVEDADSRVCDGRSEEPRGSASGRIAFRRGGPDCLWRDAELIECTDGKLRATKPGLCGMAHGVADRIHRISAIGDGQVPAVVAAMVQILGATRTEALNAKD